MRSMERGKRGDGDIERKWRDAVKERTEVKKDKE